MSANQTELLIDLLDKATRNSENIDRALGKIDRLFYCVLIYFVCIAILYIGSTRRG